MSIPAYGKYLKLLMTLPHRGTGSSMEEKAAELIASAYQKLGLKTTSHRFTILKQSWFAYLINFSILAFAGILLLSGQLFWGFLFAVLGAAQFQAFPFDFDRILIHLLKGKSQNVFAIKEPANPPQKTLVLVGHYDTGKVIYGSKLFGLAFQTLVGDSINSAEKITLNLPQIFKSPALIINTIIISYFAATAIYLVSPGNLAAHILAIWGVFWSAMHWFFTIHVLISPFVPGALDNGSGTAMVMALGEYYSDKPLANTRLIFLNCGAEENRYISNGAAHFIKYFNPDKETTYYLNFESIGDNTLTCILSESDNTSKLRKYDARATEFLANYLQSNKSEVKVADLPIASDGSSIVAAGGKMMGTLVSLSNHGMPEKYHMPSDTIKHINWSTMAKAYRFSIGLIDEFDKSFN